MRFLPLVSALTTEILFKFVLLFFTGRRLLLYCHVSGSRQTLLLGSTYILWQTMANEEVMRREESHQKVSEMRFFFLLSIECSLLIFHNKATH